MATRGRNGLHISSVKWIVVLIITLLVTSSAGDVSLEENNQQTDVPEAHPGEAYRGLQRLSRPQGHYPRHHGRVPETLRPKPETLSPGPLQPLQEPNIQFYSSSITPQQTVVREGMPKPPAKETEQLKDRINKQIQARLGTQNHQGVQQQVQPLARTSGATPDTGLWVATTQAQRRNGAVNRQSGSTVYNSQSLLVNPSTYGQTQEPQIDIIGGVGNPALMGVPISLGNSNSYLVPSDNRETTPPPIFGGVGDSLRQSSPLVFSGSFGNSNQPFVSLRNQPPVQTVSSSAVQSQHIPSFNRFGSFNNPGLAQSGQLSASQTTNFNQLVKAMQVAFDTNPSLRNYMLRILSSTKTPSLSGIGSSLVSQSAQPDSTASLNAAVQNLRQTSAAQQSKQQGNTAALLSQYYQQNPLNPAYQYQQNNLPLRIPGTFHSDAISQASPPSLLAVEQPYFPAEHSPLSIVNAPADVSQDDILGAPAVNSAVVVSPQAASVSYTNIQGCVKDTWCALALAAAVAVGATSALAVPFLAPAFLGRRRRDLQYLVFSQEEAPTFTNHFMRFMKGDVIDVPEEEVMLFKSLNDPADNRVKRMFESVKHFIVANEEKLLNITIQEIKNKKHIPIPEDILQRISNKSRENLPVSIKEMLDPGARLKGKGSNDTIQGDLSEFELSNVSATLQRPGDVYNPVTETAYIPGFDYSSLVSQPVLSNAGQGLLQSQRPVYADAAQGYHPSSFVQSHLALQQRRPQQNYFSPYYGHPPSRPTYSTHGILSGSYGSPYPHYGHNIPLHFSSSGNRDSFPVDYHHHSNFGHHRFPDGGPSSDVIVIPSPVTQQRRPLMSPAAVRFYREDNDPPVYQDVMPKFPNPPQVRHLLYRERRDRVE